MGNPWWRTREADYYGNVRHARVRSRCRPRSRYHDPRPKRREHDAAALRAVTFHGSLSSSATPGSTSHACESCMGAIQCRQPHRRCLLPAPPSPSRPDSRPAAHLPAGAGRRNPRLSRAVLRDRAESSRPATSGTFTHRIVAGTAASLRQLCGRVLIRYRHWPAIRTRCSRSSIQNASSPSRT